MERAFNRDFSSVRLHTDLDAAELSAQLQARAFTVGEHVAFAAGEFRPGTLLGDALLAHELAHVAQQGGGRAAIAPLDMEAPEYDRLERDADRSALGVVSALWGEARENLGDLRDNAIPRFRSGLALQRCSPEEAEKAKDASKDAEASKASAGSPSATAGADEAAQSPAPPPPGATLDFELQGKETKKWRINYDKKKEAQRWVDLMKKLRVKVEEPVQEGKFWTFYYYPLTQEEAEAEKKKKEKELGKKYDVKTEHNKEAETYYLKISLKCPDAMPPKTGFDIWEKCFPSESKANELKEKFDKAHVKAEVLKLDEAIYGLYYQPMKTEADAKAAGQAEASTRPGSAEGLYNVKTLRDEALKSYSYSISVDCPKGFNNIGSFLCTSYVLARESEFAEKPIAKDPCGLKGPYRQAFLFGSGVKMQGSGMANTGKIIHYAPKGKGASKTDCFEELDCPTTASGTCATSGRTVAVDPKVIPLGKELLIEDVGPRVAEDTGDRIKNQHIDVYHGTDLTMKQALDNTLRNKKVCQKA